MTWRAPVAVAEAARLGLRLRAALPPSLRGGTAIGLRRAVQLANRQPLSAATIRRMAAWFDRNGRFADADLRSRAGVAWLLWGGAAGRAWVEGLTRR